jgi:hypothetical protein
MIVKLLNILMFDMDHDVDTHMTNGVVSTLEVNQAAFMKLAGVHVSIHQHNAALILRVGLLTSPGV